MVATFFKSVLIVLPPTKGQEINLALYAAEYFLPGTEHLLNPELIVYYYWNCWFTIAGDCCREK